MKLQNKENFQFHFFGTKFWTSTNVLYIVAKVMFSSIEIWKNNWNILISLEVINFYLNIVLAAIFSRWRPNATREPRWTFFPSSPRHDLSPVKNSACTKFCPGCFFHWLDYIYIVQKKTFLVQINLKAEKSILNWPYSPVNVRNNPDKIWYKLNFLQVIDHV